MFIIEESTNGTTYDTSYLSSSDEQSVTFTPTSINVISIRCTLYKAGGITSALDIYTVPVLTDVDNMRPIIDKITTSISGVESKVDSVEKSITDKVWQSDITTQINNYDNTTVKIIRDQVAETQTSLEKIQSTVSDVQTTLTTKADGTTVQTLSEKVSKIEQDANGFKQTVEENYVTNDDLDENSKTLRSEFNQTAGEIKQSVTDLSGNITAITQDVTSIKQSVEDIEGNVTSLEETASGLKTQVENNRGDISTLQQTVSGFDQTVSNLEGDISEINQSVEGITQRVSDAEGDISTFQQTAENLQTQITNNAGNISRLEQDAEGFKTTVSNTYVTKENAVQSTDILYYLSTSTTSLVGGEWTETAPEWTNGKYMWSKTKTTYANGSVVESDPTCIAGAKGESGTEGTGIESITSEYYLSTSKDSPTGGSWSSTAPTWSNGMYVWTRSKIVYKNPVSTEYTEPICDSSWEAVNEVKDDIDNAQQTADEAAGNAAENEERISNVESSITQLADSISMLVTDEDGNSMMTQTSDGWRFDISSITDSIEEAKDTILTQGHEISGLNSTVDNLDSLIGDITEKTAYITMSTDEKGSPCIELGKQNSPFKLRITNESIDFMQDGVKIAYITNRQLYIQSSVVTDEMKVGAGSGFIWKKRSNGNMGLRWIGGN